MELYEREYFIARILSGYLRHRVTEDLTLRIYSPTIDQSYEAQEIFIEAMKEGRKNGLFTSDEVLDWMIRLDVWTNEDEGLLKKLPEDLESFKEQLYINRYKFSQTEQIRKYIAKAKQEYFDVASRRNEHEGATCQGYAMVCKAGWLTEQCTFFEDGAPYDWKLLNAYELLSRHRNDAIDEKQFRELARMDPWNSYWGIEKSILGVFGVCSAKTTTEQRAIAMYSRMYDSVHESTECPSDDVIEDDDMLDGWFINQKKTREAEKKKNQLDSSGHANAQDVYLMADGKEDIGRIQDMNDTHAQMVAKQRHRVVEGKGKINHEDLPDVKRDIQMQSSQMQAGKKG